jgi:NAD(P)-dependent dehydrogenase (short-subunit alcohol dehydrogenase family)
MLLEGKVAIVSGAGEGLGRAICVALAHHGAKVVVGDVRADAVDASVDAVRASGGDAVGRTTDITDDAQCTALVALALDSYGRLDVLVNDAYDGGDNRAFADADLDDWRRTADVNAFGTLRMTHAALAPLRASGDGRIVMICTHGVDLIQPTFGAYTASKAYLAHAIKLLAAELGPSGVRVNGVFPGPIYGAALRGHLAHLAQRAGRPLAEVEREWAARSALGYLVPPEETAGSVVYLASELARPVTGQAVYTNAGESFH